MDYGAFGATRKALAQLVLTLPELQEKRDSLPKGYGVYKHHWREAEDAAIHHQMTDKTQDYLERCNSENKFRFGHLYHKAWKAGGKVQFRLHTGERHDIDRGDSDAMTYEVSKFNPALRPRPAGASGAILPKPISEETLKAHFMAHWPRIPGLLTEAPFQYTQVRPKLPRLEQTGALATILDTHGLIGDIVKESLFANMEALSNFSRTSQWAFNWVGNGVRYMDTYANDFGLCNKSSRELEKLVLSGAMTEQDRSDVAIGKYLIVTPIRAPSQLMEGFQGDTTQFWPPLVRHNDPENQSAEFDEAGWRAESGVVQETRSKHPKRFILELNSMLGFARSIGLYGSTLQNLQIHRLNFLDLKMVEALLKHLPSIRTLGIYNCQLLHFGMTKELVDLVGKFNMKFRTEKSVLIDLDFAPRYHEGPRGQRYGSYGVTWSDPTLLGIDTTLAIATYLLPLVRTAESCGINLVRPGKAFRRWLDKVPLGVDRLVPILHSILNIIEFEMNGPEQATVILKPEKEYDNWCGLLRDMRLTVWYDFIIATLAEPQTEAELARANEKIACGKCQAVLPKICFLASKLDLPSERTYCHGCDLAWALDCERDHHNLRKAAISRDLWKGAPEVSLVWLLSKSPQARLNRKEALEMCTKIPSQRDVQNCMAQLEQKIERLTQIVGTHDDWQKRREEHRKLEEARKSYIYYGTLIGQQEPPVTCRASWYDWDPQTKKYDFHLAIEEGRFVNHAPYNNLLSLRAAENAFCMYN